MSKMKAYIFDLFDDDRFTFKDFSQIQDAEFWSSDKDANLSFKIARQGFNINKATINLYNKSDKTLILDRPMTITNNEARFKMPLDIIKHFGAWSAQVIFNELHTSPTVSFDVFRKLGDNLPEKMGLLHEWENLHDEVKAFVAEIEGFTLEEFVALKMGEELSKLEVNYATRLTGLEQKDAQITAQLAQNTYFGIENQTDFVDLINKTNAKSSTLFTKIQGDRLFEVCIPFKGNKSQQWYIEKDPNDDFMKLSGAFISEYGLSSIVSGAKEYDSKNGTWNTNTINHYTTEVGATFTTTFEGNGVNFRHMEDTRGGIWRFIIDDDPNLTLDYSTYGTSNSTKSSKLFEFLPDGEHTIVATFMGDDPENPPSGGTGTSRGWVYASGGTFQILITRYSFSKEVEVFKMTSNKEFALAITPQGSSQAQWIPEHNNVGTAFAIKQEVYFDDELVTDWEGQSNYYQHSLVQIVQKIYGKHPDNANNLVEFITIHTFNADGVFTKTKMNVLEDIKINTGYALMCPVHFPFTDKMVTSLDNSYEITSTVGYDSTNLSENDKALSYLFIGNSSYPNYVGAMTINQPKKTLRVGKDGRRSPLAWLQFRSSNRLAKLYLQVFENYQATAGEVFDFSGTYTIGEIPLANELYG